MRASGTVGIIASILLGLECQTSQAFLVPRPTTCGTPCFGLPFYQKQHTNRWFSPHVLSTTKGSNDSDDKNDDDAVFFDDFDFVIGGGSTGENENQGGALGQGQQQLMARIQEYQKEVVRKDTQLAKNWKCGNWKVRGFSLDKFDATFTVNEQGMVENAQETAIHVAHVAKDPSVPDRIAVARTDGSVCLVRLGSEFLAKFTSKLTATSKDSDKDEGDFSVEITSQLVRDEDDMGNGMEQRDDSTTSEQQQQFPQETPFEVTHQFVAHGNSTLSAMLMEDDMMFTAGQDGSDIMVWSVPEEEDEKFAPIRTLTNAHGGTVVSLKTISMNREGEETDSPTLLVSVANDGSFALWDMSTGDLVTKRQMQSDNEEKGATVTCADVYNNVLYLGLSSGYVVGYVLNEVLEASPYPEPNCRFLAYEQDGVSAIQCAGDGTLGRSRPGAQSSILLTGGTDGVVKQWEMLSRTMPPQDENEQPKTKLEHWPRLATQRMQKRAHLFKGHSEGTPITALACMDPSKFLSAGEDGTVRTWNPQTGKELFLMDGFVDGGVTSLCLDRDMLVTNGMDAYVCVHDFDVTENEVEDGYEMEW